MLENIQIRVAELEDVQRDHGLTVWAASTEKARSFVERLEYLFRYRVMARQLTIEV